MTTAAGVRPADAISWARPRKKYRLESERAWRRRCSADRTARTGESELKEAIDRTRALGVDLSDFKNAMSRPETGAVEMAMWSLAGSRRRRGALGKLRESGERRIGAIEGCGFQNPCGSSVRCVADFPCSANADIILRQNASLRVKDSEFRTGSRANREGSPFNGLRPAGFATADRVRPHAMS